MCGVVVLYKMSATPFDARLLQTMTHTLSHRGPDDAGFCFVGPQITKVWQQDIAWQTQAPGVAMGHRRLSILDLSASGHQPFVSQDQRYWMVYNGEIYNYLELRTELAQLGHRFFSETDTEVFLAAFAQWGTDCFNRLNGMWAVLIWDQHEQTLVASRDRFGEKPLFYTQVGSDWYFASEAKALFKHPDIPARPNERALFHYLRFFRPPSGEDSYFAGIMMVEPGTYMVLSRDHMRKTRYWDLPAKAATSPLDEPQAIAQFLTLFTDAVKIRLRADVRVGTMLSGGLDSTSIIRTVADLLASDSSALRVVGPSLQAFNASFPGERIDETARVDDLCAAIHLTAHKVFPMEEQDIEALVSEVAYHIEMPFFGSVPLVHTLLMRKARAAGVKVLLNGHAADEVFAGYPEVYCPAVAADAIRHGHWCRGVGEMLQAKRRHNVSWHRTVFHYLLPWRVSRWLGRDDDYGTFFAPHLLQQQQQVWARIPPKQFPGATELERVMKRHLLAQIVPDWLALEDRISMSASIESRLPFLDYRLVEFAFSLGDRLKIRHGRTKYLVRAAMQNRLPPSIVAESRKFRFSGPDAYWLQGPLRGLLDSMLDAKTSYVSHFLAPSALATLLATFRAGDHRRAQFIWRILHTEMWLRRYCA